MIVLIDFKKASNEVTHDTSIKKVNHAGVNGSFLTLLKRSLTGRQVKVGNSTCRLKTVNFGVSQASILSLSLSCLFYSVYSSLQHFFLYF